MRDQKTASMSTVDTADPDVTERDVAERDVAERDVPEDVPEADVAERDESETANERAEMVADAPRDTDTPTADPSTSVAAPESTPNGAATTSSSTVDESAELAPGEAPAPRPTTLWAGEDSDALRERWRELQSRFVDDPHGAAAAADDLIGEAVDSITEALAAQRQQLGQWRAGGDFDTERLRVAVTGYRDFLDRVLSI